MNSKIPLTAAVGFLALTPLFAAGPFGVNGDWDWMNLIQGIGGWSSPTGGNLALDANGWPMGDAQAVLVDARRNMPWRAPDAPARNPNISGVYHLAFTGQALIQPQSENGSEGILVRNQKYDASANTTTADIVFKPCHWLMILNFLNTKRTPGDSPGTGFTNMKVLAPGVDPHTTQVFTDDTLKAYAAGKFSANRFLGEDGANSYCSNLGNCFMGSKVASAKWADRVLVTDAFQGGLPAKNTNHHESHGAAWEYMIMISNLTNTDMWINVPVNAGDDYVRQLATLIKNGNAYTNGLNSGLHVYVEYSNEVWNYGFNQAIINGAYAGQEGIANDQRYVERTIEVAKIFANVFGPGSLNTTVRAVALWQYTTETSFFSALQWAEQRFHEPVKRSIYGIGEAPYYNANDTSSVDNIFSTMWTNSDSTRTDFIGWQSVAAYFGLKEVGYESGPSLVGGTGAYATRDPRMVVSEKHHFLDNWFAVGGDQVNFFSLRGAVSEFGDWLLVEDFQHLNTSKMQGAQAIVASPRPSFTAGYILPSSIADSPANIDPSQRTADPFSLQAFPGSGLTISPGSTNLYLLRSTGTGAFSFELYGHGDAGSRVQAYLDDELLGSAALGSTDAYKTIGTVSGIGAGWHTLYLTGTDSGNTSLPAGTGTIRITRTAGSGGSPVPSAPMNLSASVNSNLVALTWATTTAASKYTVKRSTSSGGPYTTVGATALNTFTDRSVASGTPYFYVVTASNATGEGAVSPQIPVVPTPPAAPATPSGLNATASAGDPNPFFPGGIVYLTWNIVPNAVSYNIKNSTVKGGPYNTVTSQLATSYKDLSVSNGNTYYYVVSAVNSFGESADSAEIVVTPTEKLPPAPGNLTATQGSGYVLLRWQPYLGATSQFGPAFNVKRSTTPGGPYTNVCSLNTFNAADYSIASGSTYYYVVSELNGLGEGPNSQEVQATAP